MARGTRGEVVNGSGSASNAGSEQFVDPIDLDRANDSVEITVEPGAVGTARPEPKRRGRKPGSAQSQKASVSIEGVEGILLSIHMMVAAATKIQEAALSPPEAKALAQAINNVARHYPTFKTTQQTIDWLMLIGAVSTVYVPRVMAYNIRVKREAAAARPPAAVHPLRPEAPHVAATEHPFGNA